MKIFEKFAPQLTCARAYQLTIDNLNRHLAPHLASLGNTLESKVNGLPLSDPGPDLPESVRLAQGFLPDVTRGQLSRLVGSEPLKELREDNSKLPTDLLAIGESTAPLTYPLDITPYFSESKAEDAASDDGNEDDCSYWKIIY